MASYKAYKKTFKNQQFPLAFVDMDLLDQNIQSILTLAKKTTIRIASKSIRSNYILEYILSSSKQFKGIMSFSAEESIMLAEKGFDDILMGYPCVDKALISKIADQIILGKTIVLMVDLIKHIQLINTIGKEKKVQIAVCIDLDCSSDYGPIHFGVWRSSIKKREQLQVVLDEIKKSNFIKLEGLMGYEAQIAGIPDNVKGDYKNKIIKFLKRKSLKEIEKRRSTAIHLIKENGFDIRFVNGGGTGSIKQTIQEDKITEITVGSGFYNPHLFDNYTNFSFQPAAGFALQIVRNPKQHYFTCHGGGYIASGKIEKIKQPQIYFPKEAFLDSNEGCGEVQTPIIYKEKEGLKIGDPIFLRHAKAGELCERFTQLFLIRDTKIFDKTNTYRGDGYAFL